MIEHRCAKKKKKKGEDLIDKEMYLIFLFTMLPKQWEIYHCSVSHIFARKKSIIAKKKTKLNKRPRRKVGEGKREEKKILFPALFFLVLRLFSLLLLPSLPFLPAFFFEDGGPHVGRRVVLVVGQALTLLDITTTCRHHYFPVVKKLSIHLHEHLALKPGQAVAAQPPTVVCKNGSSVGIRARCTHVFFARLVPTCMLGRCLATKLPHRSSGGSLLWVRCWLGFVCLLEWGAPGTGYYAPHAPTAGPLQNPYAFTLIS